jgi:hypothetical protein
LSLIVIVINSFIQKPVYFQSLGYKKTAKNIALRFNDTISPSAQGATVEGWLSEAEA